MVMIIHSEALDLQRTTVQDLAFVLAIEQSELNRIYIGQWTKAEHAAALQDPDILHLTIWDSSGKKSRLYHHYRTSRHSSYRLY